MRKHPPEQIIPKPRAAGVELAGGLKADDAKRLKELEAEDERLKRLVAQLALDKRVLREVVQKKS